MPSCLRCPCLSLLLLSEIACPLPAPPPPPPPPPLSGQPPVCSFMMLYCLLIIYQWVIAALREVCLPLHVETGRYRTPKTPYHLQTCTLCLSIAVETGFHFIMLWPALEHVRSSFFNCFLAYSACLFVFIP